MRALASTLLTSALVIGAFGCAKKNDEAQIREIVAEAITAVDEKKPGQIVENAAEDFRGPRNIDLRETRRYITGYMLGSGWLRAFVRSLDVSVSGDTAHVDLEVVLAKGQQIKSIEDVLPTNGSVLDFDLELEKRGGDWLFVKGEYKQLKW